MNQKAEYLEIGKRIQWHRTVLEGDTQSEYAEKIGVSRANVAAWEAGYSRVKIDKALLLRERYGLSLDFIYAGNADALPLSLRKAWMERSSDKAAQ